MLLHLYLNNCENLIFIPMISIKNKRIVMSLIVSYLSCAIEINYYQNKCNISPVPQILLLEIRHRYQEEEWKISGVIAHVERHASSYHHKDIKDDIYNYRHEINIKSLDFIVNSQEETQSQNILHKHCLRELDGVKSRTVKDGKWAQYSSEHW